LETLRLKVAVGHLNLISDFSGIAALAVPIAADMAKGLWHPCIDFTCQRRSYAKPASASIPRTIIHELDPFWLVSSTPLEPSHASA